MKDMCSAPGCDKALLGKQMQCSRCQSALYCSKACQVAAWPHHKQCCGKKKSCEMFAVKISNTYKGIVVYNVVNEHYQNSRWECILKNEKEVLDNMDSENEMGEGIDSYMFKTRIYGMMAEAGVDMLKCSFCNVTRFCDKVCQKGAYCKRPSLKMGITLSHGSLCPLLKTWKQVKKGNATVKSCV